LQKLRLIIIGIGFFWIFSWSVFGSLLGAYIENLILTGIEPSASMMWQRTLLRSAHAHMNSMGITIILVGLTLPILHSLISEKKIKILVTLNLASIPLFGFGIILQAFYPPSVGNFSLTTLISAVGGVLYLISLALFSSLFFFASFKKNNSNAK
jgi:hypothetical protein